MPIPVRAERDLRVVHVEALQAVGPDRFETLVQDLPETIAGADLEA